MKPTPIAVTGIGCRFPGNVDDVGSFWNLLMQGVDAVADIPPERWLKERFHHPQRDRNFRTPQAQGGFLRDIDAFDPAFFGISPREASTIDPQQRILLEVAWEALEDAGYPLKKVAGTRMGVFTGASSHDYYDIQDVDSLTTHSVTGWAMCMTSNRVSYAFDLHGPSVTLDTACSSSLVALHAAVTSLQHGECDSAMVCAVNALLHPIHHLAFSRLSMLSPTSRCHAFDQSGDGYVRSEGAGVVVLKPLEQALADGDRVYATILRTVVNSDGRNEGLTMPSVEGQTRLLQEAYRDLPIEHVRYVEAHGTGTAAGDPVETTALGTVLGRSDRSLMVGSVKTNIGHLEAGAGMAGLIKTCLVAAHRQVPGNLHFENPNPDIDFAGWGLEIPTAPSRLPDTELLMGVNSFGFGGTNAHVVLSPPPSKQAKQLSFPAAPQLLCLSARSEGALKELLERYQRLNDDELRGISYSALTRRTHHPFRTAVVAQSLSDLREAPSQPPARQAPRIAFVYSGQGSQWQAMGRSLLADPNFSALVDECDPHYLEHLGWSLREAFLSDSTSTEKTAVVQPMIFALQAGLTRMLKAWGVEPEVVIGHSVGEVAAAWASGALTLAEAVNLISHRASLMDRESSRGRMLSVSASAAQVTPFLNDQVCIGCINSPTTVVLSGQDQAVQQAGQALTQAGYECSEVKVEYAFHSAQLDVVQEELLAKLATLAPGPATTTMISTVTAAPTQDLGAPYWWQNVRSTVRFSEAIARAVSDGITLFLEVGGHPVLGASIDESGGRAVPTLRRHQDEQQAFLKALAQLYIQGQDLEWGDGSCPDWVSLPHYPWQRERYWRESRRVRRFRLEPSNYALLGHQAEPNIFHQLVTPDTPSWLQDHRFHQQPILSASSFMEMGFEAAHAQRGALPVALDGVHIESACFVNDQVRLQTIVNDDGTLAIYAQASEGTEHRDRVFRAHICDDPGGLPEDLDWKAIEARLPETWLGSLTPQWAERGLGFGPTFDAIQKGRKGPGEALAWVRGAALLPATDGLSLTHPGTVDSCFQVGLAALDAQLMGEGTNWLPVSARRVRVLRPMEEEVIAYMRCTHQTARELEGDLTVCNLQGQVLFDLRGYRLVRAAESARQAIDELCYALNWLETEFPPIEATASKDKPWLVVSDGGTLASELVERLKGDGYAVEQVGTRESFDLKKLGPLSGCLHLASLSADLNDPATPLMPLLEMVQQVEKYQILPPRLVVVTGRSQAIPVTDLPVTPESSPVWGLVRVLSTEDPALHTTLIDIESESDGDLVYREMFTKAQEEVAFRGGRRYIHRCHRSPLSEKQPAVRPPVVDEDYRLVCDRTGTLEALQWNVAAPAALQPNEVRVKVQAAGLNFSDVMRALGLYPTEGVLGIEMAGTVAEVGSQVGDLQPGQRVMGIAPAAFASSVVVPRAFVVPTSGKLSDIEAAAMPLVFATAYYALVTVGRLKAGETILIHSASGGLGLAAIQVARRQRARILATAGTPEKVSYLHSQGIEHVFDSRSTSFVDGVLGVCPEGVDMVLNSLAGEGLTGGLSVLGRFGRFLDVTKKDIYNDLRVGLSPFRRGLSYHAIDLEQVINYDHSTVQELLETLMTDLTRGQVSALPVHQTFPFGQAVDAFRCLSQARHVGKVVLTAEPPELVRSRWRPYPGAAYLVTGGMGGFGREVVHWLLGLGADQVVVLSRNPGAHEGFEDSRVVTRAVDVGDSESVAKLFKEFANVRGVVHAAMQLDDVPTLNLTRERLEGVFQAKIHGAWNLHQATLDRPLDFFVLFSSNAAWFGAAGQGNYAAANAFLDSLAHHRRHLGLPALTVNWGPLGDVGYLARNPSVAAWLESGGSKMITSSEALEAMERALDIGSTQLGVMNADWALLRKAMGNKPVPRFEALLTDNASKRDESGGIGHLETLQPEDRRAALEPVVVAQVARVLGTQPQRLDVSQSLIDMGLDSLMSLQLRNWTKSTLNVNLASSTLMEQPSVATLIDLLSHSMEPKANAGSTDEESLDYLEEDEIDAMLASMLEDSPA